MKKTLETFEKGCAGIVANVSKKHTAAAARLVISELEKNGFSWKLEEMTARHIDRPNEGLPMPELANSITWLIVIGGDGTILQAAREIVEHHIPLLGINPGRSFGFMADTLIDEVSDTLKSIKNLEFDIIKRSTLKAEFYSSANERKILPFALNDVTFTHGAEARLISLNVNVNDELLSTYSADGLIFATATGSTAHSMSAGGPILYPSVDAIALTPICPHTLSNRPIILPHDCKIEVFLNKINCDVLVITDGQVTEKMKPNDRVIISSSDYKAHFIHLKRHSFASILRKKLKWTGDLKNGSEE